MQRLCEIVIVGTVVFGVSLPLLGVILYLLWGDPSLAHHYALLIATRFVWLGFMCAVCLLLWIYQYDGVNSSLWKWLPPFFPNDGCSDGMKRAMVVFLAVGTLLGFSLATWTLLIAPSN